MLRKNPLASRAARRRVTVQVMAQVKPAEARYVRDLRAVSKAIAREYAKRIAPYLEELAKKPTEDAKEKTPERLAYEASVAEARAARLLNPLANELDVLGAQVQIAIPRTVGPLFDRMSGAVTRGNAKGQALFGIEPKNTGLSSVIAKAREANIALITNAHQDYAGRVKDILSDPANFGLRVEELTDKLLERGDVSGSRAELIARDQTLKLNGAITSTRQQAAGVSQYVWSTSLDDRVRDEHAELEGQTFDWSNPPAPGHPGEDIQCRCVAVPVVSELEGVFGDG